MRELLPLFALPLMIACQSGEGDQDLSAASAVPGSLGGGQSTVVDNESQKNVVQIAVASPDHRTLVAAVQHVNYEDVLVNAGPFTVYAPTDAAFNALPAGTLDELMKPENKEKLENILEYHVALGVLKPESMKNGMHMGMANGDNVIYKVTDDGTVMINDAKVLGSVPASNGLVVVIDKVLLPPAK